MKELSIIPDSAQITIVVSGGFYARINQMILNICNTIPKEELTEVLTYLKSGKESELKKSNINSAYHLETLFVLSQEIEKIAKEQNLIQKIDIDSIKVAP